MSYRIAEEDGRATVFLAGEIDLERSPAARQSLLAALKRGGAVVVDMGAVSYMDSSGIASLVEAFQKARAARQDFSLARVGEPVLKVLKLARLDEVFTIRSAA